MFFGKVKSQKGETLVEALSAFLIICLMITMLAEVVTVSANTTKKDRAYKASQEQLIEQYWKGNSTSTSKTTQEITLANNGADISFQCNLVKTVCRDDDRSLTVYEVKPLTS